MHVLYQLRQLILATMFINLTTIEIGLLEYKKGKNGFNFLIICDEVVVFLLLSGKNVLS